MAKIGRNPAIPIMRYGWVIDRAEEGLSFRKLAQRYYAAFGEHVHYATFQRLLHKLNSHSFYGPRAQKINKERERNGNTCAANAVKKQLHTD